MKKLFNSIIIALAAVLTLGSPVYASEPTETKPTVPPTFAEETSADDELAKLRFGKNLLFAGNNITVNSKGNGLLFAFGNQLQLGSESEYTFVAGNLINYSATTAKDLFVAGNVVDLKSDAQIGRDVYASAFRVVLATNLKGDFSAAANQIVLRDVTIAGNANLDAETISFEGKVTIDGTLNYNQGAQVSGLDNVKATKVETYVPETYQLTATELWLSKLTTIISLSLVAIFILALSTRVREQVAGASAVQNFGVNLIAGFIVLLAMPIVAVLLLISIFAAPLGIILIAVYFVMIYLSQALAGAWLGHAFISKLLRTQTHVFIEAIVGIAILVCCSMVPGLNILISFLATLLGLGIMVSAIRHKKATSSPELQPAPASPKSVKAAKVVSTKSTSGTKTAKATKATKPARTTKTAKSSKAKKS